MTTSSDAASSASPAAGAPLGSSSKMSDASMHEHSAKCCSTARHAGGPQAGNAGEKCRREMQAGDARAAIVDPQGSHGHARTHVHVRIRAAAQRRTQCAHAGQRVVGEEGGGRRQAEAVHNHVMQHCVWEQGGSAAGAERQRCNIVLIQEPIDGAARPKTQILSAQPCDPQSNPLAQGCSERRTVPTVHPVTDDRLEAGPSPTCRAHTSGPLTHAC
eukprot:357973-Chlamydomonas_euryale.AAC.1